VFQKKHRSVVQHRSNVVARPRRTRYATLVLLLTPLVRVPCTSRKRCSLLVLPLPCPPLAADTPHVPRTHPHVLRRRNTETKGFGRVTSSLAFANGSCRLPGRIRHGMGGVAPARRDKATARRKQASATPEQRAEQQTPDEASQARGGERSSRRSRAVVTLLSTDDGRTDGRTQGGLVSIAPRKTNLSNHPDRLPAELRTTIRLLVCQPLRHAALFVW
jgi:hypothetical protein